MKKNIYLLLTLFLSVYTYYAYADKGPEDFSGLKKLKGRTLLVVIDNNTSIYGKALKESFETRWTATPVKFVNSAQAYKYIDSSRYAIFSFAILCHLYKGRNAPGKDVGRYYTVGGDVVLKETELQISEDSTPHYFRNWQLENNPSGNQVTDEACSFEFFLCESTNGWKQSLDKLNVCFKSWAYVDPDSRQKQPIKYCHNQLVLDVLPSVVRYNAEAVRVLSGKKDKVKKKVLKTPGYRNGVQTNMGFRMWTYDHNESLEKVRSKKIYIDSILVNDTSMRYLRKIMKIDSTSLIRVNKREINKLIKERSPDKLIFDYLQGGANNNLMTFGIYTTEGEKLLDVLTDLKGISYGVRTYHITF